MGLLLAGMLVRIGVIDMFEETFGAQIFFIEVAITLIWLSVEFALFCYIEVIQIILSLFQHLSYGIITEILYSAKLKPLDEEINHHCLVFREGT